MGIPVTRLRLDRAEFFLGMMEEHAHGALLHAPRDWDMIVCGHYLSAFIQAARSVPWVFQSENRAVYDRVQPAWDAAMTDDERSLLSLMNDLRLDEVHRTGAELERGTRLIPTTEARRPHPRESAPHLAWLRILGASEGAPVPQVGVLAPRVVAAGGKSVDVDLFAECRRYVELLERLVRAGEELIGRAEIGPSPP